MSNIKKQWQRQIKIYTNYPENFDAKLRSQKYALSNNNRLSLKRIQKWKAMFMLSAEQCFHRCRMREKKKKTCAFALAEMKIGRPKCEFELNVKCHTSTTMLCWQVFFLFFFLFFFCSVCVHCSCASLISRNVMRLWGLCWTANTKLRWKAIYFNCKLGINSFELSETFFSCHLRCTILRAKNVIKKLKWLSMFAVLNTEGTSSPYECDCVMCMWMCMGMHVLGKAFAFRNDQLNLLV